MKQEDTKQKILDKALELFSSRGYDAVSVGEIAQAVGIKAPSLYNHFPSKQAIFDALVESVAAQYTRDTDQISIHVQNAPQDIPVFTAITEDALFDKVRQIFEYSLHNETIRRFRRMMTIEQFRSPELSRLYTERYITRVVRYHAGLFESLIAAARKSADAGAFVCFTSHHPPWHLRPRARTGGRVLREAARACGSLLPHLQPVGKRQSISKRNTSMKKRNFTLLWLALCILPTAMLQLRGRIRSTAVRKTVLCLLAAVTAMLVVGRLISGVHWLSDILGSVFLSAGLVLLYAFICPEDSPSNA